MLYTGSMSFAVVDCMLQLVFSSSILFMLDFIIIIIIIIIIKERFNVAFSK